jgi:hypothetical protein
MLTILTSNIQRRLTLLCCFRVRKQMTCLKFKKCSHTKKNQCKSVNFKWMYIFQKHTKTIIERMVIVNMVSRLSITGFTYHFIIIITISPWVDKNQHGENDNTHYEIGVFHILLCTIKTSLFYLTSLSFNTSCYIQTLSLLFKLTWLFLQFTSIPGTANNSLTTST